MLQFPKGIASSERQPELYATKVCLWMILFLFINHVLYLYCSMHQIVLSFPSPFEVGQCSGNRIRPNVIDIIRTRLTLCRPCYLIVPRSISLLPATIRASAVKHAVSCSSSMTFLPQIIRWRHSDIAPKAYFKALRSHS